MTGNDVAFKYVNSDSDLVKLISGDNVKVKIDPIDAWMAYGGMDSGGRLSFVQVPDGFPNTQSALDVWYVERRHLQFPGNYLHIPVIHKKHALISDTHPDYADLCAAALRSIGRG